jgi:hypothetical protein
VLFELLKTLFCRIEVTGHFSVATEYAMPGVEGPEPEAGLSLSPNAKVANAWLFILMH